MIIHPSETFEVIWIAWFVSWMAASFWSGRTEKRAATWDTWAYRTTILCGAILIAPWTARVLGERPIWQVGDSGAYALVGVMLLGLLLTWLARIHLGRLWSSAITRKQEHRIVDTGPYAFVRHPIYTGIIIALVATAATEATLVALLGAALIAFGLYLKARAEERFLMVELGPDAYRSYCRRVPMLVPFLPPR
ncbi:MAG TPA: isoprenylcysteine carboxylmethyltransferase family protein [Xanthobacteraceae bacterium]